MCRICQEIEKTGFKLYDDNEIVVFLANWGVKGLCIVAPKQHYTILEQVPDEIFSKCLLMANKVAGLVFQVLGCQGTNILINNGDGANQMFSHFTIQVIPRFENDNLKLDWERRPADQSELKNIASKLEFIANSEGNETITKEQTKEPEAKKEIKEDMKEKKEESNKNDNNSKEGQPKKKIPRWLIRIP